MISPWLIQLRKGFVRASTQGIITGIKRKNILKQAIAALTLGSKQISHLSVTKLYNKMNSKQGKLAGGGGGGGL